MNIALIAHDKKKEEMINFCILNKDELSKHNLIATGTTGSKIKEKTNLDITRLISGPLGGDQEIGTLAANKKIDMLLFFRDPLSALPHEPDVTALLRICDVYKVAVATNSTTATYLINYISNPFKNF